MKFLSTAPSLLIGLGARIVTEWLFRSQEPNPADPRIGHTLLVGLWQGVALYYAFMQYPAVSVGVGFGISARLIIDYMLVQNAMKSATTLIGVALGVLCTDVLSQFLEDGYSERRVPQPDTRTPESEMFATITRRRLVQFRRSVDGESRASRQHIPPTSSEGTALSAPSMTSTDTLDPTGTMTPLEREVAALRKRASLADTERRRYKEERKWALSQGNKARAEQMAWQVKRYTALTQSFHREADARLIEATTSRARESQRQEPLPRPPIHEPSSPGLHRRVSVEIGRQRKRSIGTYKSDVHVEVR